MSSPESLSIPTPRAELAALAWGPADASPVLALHGWLDNAATFAALAPRLDGLRIVALDFPGHGRSAHLAPGADYPFIEWIATAYEATRALGWDRYAVLGHSMGAAVGSMLAGTTPDAIRRFVAIEGMGPMAEPDEEAPARLRKALTQRPTTSVAWIDEPARARARFAKARSLTIEQAERLFARATVREGDGRMRWGSDPRLRHASRWRFSEARVLAFLSQVTCPVLAVRAADGSPFAPSDRSPRLAALSDVRLVTVAGGHHLHVSHPAEVAVAIGDFLRGSDAPP